MIVVFFKAAFLFQRKREDANYSALIWLPSYVSMYKRKNRVELSLNEQDQRRHVVFLTVL